MTDSYRDGYKEGVIFLFHDDGSILIEHRPDGDGTETFIPNGTIEERDAASDRYEDYVLAALHREIDEEFAGRVRATDVEKLCEYRVEEPAIWFYSYAVTDWHGTVPDHTVENGERYAELEWVPLREHAEHLEYGSAIETCATLQEQLDAASSR